MSEQFKVITAYILICLIWGSTWLAIKIGLESLTPLLAAGLRFSVASIVLYIIITIRKISIPWGRETLWFYGTVALTSFSVPFALVYWGEQRIASGLTSVVFAIYPFCVALFSAAMLPKENLSLAKIMGMILGFVGIAIIFSHDISFGDEETLGGMTAVLLSAMLQAYSVVVIKKYGHDISPFVVSFVPMLVGAVLLLSASAAVEDFSVSHFTGLAIGSILYLALFGTVLTFVSYFWLIKRVHVVLLSLTSFVTPIIAVLLGAVILHEAVTLELFIGAACVLLGIIIANFFKTHTSV